MKSLFVITSAICTKFGVYDNKMRLAQTISTLASIRKYMPDAAILIAEASGGRSIDKHESNELLKYADSIINLSSSPEILNLYSSTENWDVVKNGSEMMSCIKVYNYLLASETKYDRIFKLSGRYKLNDNFDVNVFRNNPDKIIFANKRSSQFSPETTGGLVQQYMCRLYSFPGSELQNMCGIFGQMFSDFIDTLNKKQYRDLEHLMHKYLHDKAMEIPTIGVEGLLGPTGKFVKD
jgi:hypothetical protein